MPYTSRHALPRRTLRRRSARPALAVFAAGAACAASLNSGMGSAAAATNLVVNPGFESGVTGWFASSGAALGLAGGASGAHSGQVTNTSGGTRTVALNDKTNTVASTTRGATYTASAKVRLTRAGTSAGIRMMEYANTTLIGQNQGSLTLNDTAWHTVSVTYTALSSGASIDLNVLAWSLPNGAAIDVDDASLVSSSAATASPPPPASSAPSGWHQVWGDEFNGSSVDTSKWRVLNNSHSSNETSCLTSRWQNVAESGGLLHIKAQRENYTCNGYSASWTSGYLNTIGKFSRTYGRFEMRAKLPTAAGTSKGMWPAFWLRPDDGGAGEIDIMEAIGSGPTDANDNRVSQTLWYDYNGTYPRQNVSVVTSPMSEGFHTYAIEWEPTAMRWYIDGKLTWTRDSSSIWWITSSVFRKPYNIRLNLQVGGSWPKSPTWQTASPQDYQVDWVRVYSR